MEKFQVLLSSYNGEQYIKEQLDTIFSQKGVDVHCLVRDDGSTDNTINILDEYSMNQPNLKVVIGDNIGYKSSFMNLIELSGEFDYYAFADQDDIWEENKLTAASEQIKTIKSDINTAVMYCSNCKLVDNELKYISMLHSSKSILPKSKTEALAQGFAHGCTIVFNLEAKKIINRYKVKNEYAHDFWVPIIILFTGRVIYDPNSYILYRQHNDNVFGGQRSLLKIFSIKIKQFNLNRDFHSNMILEILEGYGDLITSQDYKILKEITNYKNSIYYKIKALLNPQLRRETFKGTLFLKLLILFSKY
jgi:rhamnosyltransferase